MIAKVLTGMILVVVVISLVTIIATEINSGIDDDNNSISKHATFLRFIPTALVMALIAICISMVYAGVKDSGWF